MTCSGKDKIMTGQQMAARIAAAVVACFSLSAAGLAQPKDGKIAPTYNPRAYVPQPVTPRADKFQQLFETPMPDMPDPFTPLPAQPQDLAKGNAAPAPVPTPDPPPDFMPEPPRPDMLFNPGDTTSSYSTPRPAPRDETRFSAENSTSSYSTSQGMTTGMETTPLYSTIPRVNQPFKW